MHLNYNLYISKVVLAFIVGGSSPEKSMSRRFREPFSAKSLLKLAVVTLKS